MVESRKKCWPDFYEILHKNDLYAWEWHIWLGGIGPYADLVGGKGEGELIVDYNMHSDSSIKSMEGMFSESVGRAEVVYAYVWILPSLTIIYSSYK